MSFFNVSRYKEITTVSQVPHTNLISHYVAFKWKNMYSQCQCSHFAIHWDRYLWPAPDLVSKLGSETHYCACLSPESSLMYGRSGFIVNTQMPYLLQKVSLLESIAFWPHWQASALLCIAYTCIILRLFDCRFQRQSLGWTYFLGRLGWHPDHASSPNLFCAPNTYILPEDYAIFCLHKTRSSTMAVAKSKQSWGTTFLSFTSGW